MNNETILTVSNLGKRFKLYHRKQDRLKEWISMGHKQAHQDFWAIRNVNFELERGDFFGILGHNGAGKSTLLKMLSGVLTPSEGSFEAKGRMLALLELGIGTNPALTGRQNTYNRAKIFGISSTEVDDRIHDIMDFSELGEFFDYPVSTYSSGMRSRLNFSTFAFLDCDILILDEVLAVGDIVFKQKCYNRMDELIQKNTTIILVTHSVQYVNNFCNKVLVLDNGEQAYCGEKDEGVRVYGRMRHKSLRTVDPSQLPAGSKQAERIVQVQAKLADDQWAGEEIDWPAIELFPTIQPVHKNNLILDQFMLVNKEGIETTLFEQGDTATAYFTFRVAEEALDGIPAGGILIFDNLNRQVHAKDNYQSNPEKNYPRNLQPGSFIRFKQDVVMNLKPGKYMIRVRMLQVLPEDEVREVVFPAGPPTSFDVIVPMKNALFASFEGLVDLPGSSAVQWKMSQPKTED